MLDAAAVEVDVGVVSQHLVELLAQVDEVSALEVGVEFQVLGHGRRFRSRRIGRRAVLFGA